MQNNQGQTQMTNPPKKETKMVKMKVNREVLVSGKCTRPDGEVQQLDRGVAVVGSTIEVDEDQAKQLEKPFKNVYGFYGKRISTDATFGTIQRAVRIG